MMELISENEVARKVCLNTIFQSIFMTDKPSFSAELKESPAYMNGANAGILYETHSCLFMSRPNTNRGDCLQQEMRGQLSKFFFPCAAPRRNAL
jgi:hypothetical protein